jgi:flavin reductase (DIM6/NTAB) family NADH-FMN oxidoreductase RutF
MEKDRAMDGRSSSGQRFLGWFWTPLVVVTAAEGQQRSGQIAVSAHGASIVPERPRLSVALWKGNLTRDLTERSGAFAVHLLRDDQDELVYHFGLQSGAILDKFEAIEYSIGVTGAPLLNDCLALFECRVVARMDGGDHTLFLGDVVSSAARSDGAPLWWRDLRLRMPGVYRERWEAMSAANQLASLETMDQFS